MMVYALYMVFFDSYEKQTPWRMFVWKAKSSKKKNQIQVYQVTEKERLPDLEVYFLKYSQYTISFLQRTGTQETGALFSEFPMSVVYLRRNFSLVLEFF